MMRLYPVISSNARELNCMASLRYGVVALYVSCKPSENPKELFSEEYVRVIKVLRMKKRSRRKPAPYIMIKKKWM